MDNLSVKMPHCRGIAPGLTFLLCGALSGCGGGGSSPQQTIEVRDITPVGESNIWQASISSNGHVEASNLAGTQFYRIFNGVSEQLAPSTSTVYSIKGINNSGDVVGVGIADHSGIEANGGTLVNLPTTIQWTGIGGILDDGSIVNDLNNTVTLYSSLGVSSTLPLPGLIDNVDVVAGKQVVAQPSVNASTAYRFDGTNVTTLSASTANPGIAVFAVNQDGYAVGNCHSPFGIPGAVVTMVPCVWDPSGNRTDLPVPSGALDTTAIGINGRGDIVGEAQYGTGITPHVIVWQRGTLVDLSPQLPTASTRSVCGVDDAGDILITSLSPDAGNRLLLLKTSY